MRNPTDVSGMRRLLVAGLATACLWGTNSYAASEEDAVKAAVAAYNAAVDSLDPAKIEALWAHDDTVTNIEPTSKTVVVGWDAIKKNIEGFFPAFASVKNVQLDGPYVQIKGDVARSIGVTNATFKLKNGMGGSNGIFEVDVFEKRDGAWLVVSHCATVVPK